jgi:hypothetical protein
MKDSNKLILYITQLKILILILASYIDIVIS